MALMLVLETLSPTERAVFVLREVFDVDYEEIATAVGKTPATVRQIAHRARKHVDARRPRQTVSPTELRFPLALGSSSLLEVVIPGVDVFTGVAAGPARRR